jgi:hypothetical protein
MSTWTHATRSDACRWTAMRFPSPPCAALSIVVGCRPPRRPARCAGRVVGRVATVSCATRRRSRVPPLALCAASPRCVPHTSPCALARRAPAAPHARCAARHRPRRVSPAALRAYQPRRVSMLRRLPCHLPHCPQWPALPISPFAACRSAPPICRPVPP